jgi:hypothetical protein
VVRVFPQLLGGDLPEDAAAAERAMDEKRIPSREPVGA